jgi:methyltransferase (TIGR00027 family)
VPNQSGHYISARGVKVAPSETASATATIRALAAYDPREEVRGPDTLAELFLTEEQKAPLRDVNIREWVMKNKITPGAYEFMIARTAFFDELVRQALDEKTPQLVFLGAGYDSRPYRFADLLGDASVFELDALPTQLRKKERLDQAGVHIPVSIKFIPVDFAVDDLGHVLLHAGYTKEKAALFLWEGVTYYLSKESVDRTLSAVKSISATGSHTAFDFASLSAEALSEEGAKKLREHLNSNHPAEPTRFGIPDGKLESFLSARGFQVVQLFGPQEMETRYLSLRDGSTIGHVPAIFNLVVAQAK